MHLRRSSHNKWLFFHSNPLRPASVDENITNSSASRDQFTACKAEVKQTKIVLAQGIHNKSGYYGSQQMPSLVYFLEKN